MLGDQKGAGQINLQGHLPVAKVKIGDRPLRGDHSGAGDRDVERPKGRLGRFDGGDDSRFVAHVEGQADGHFRAQSIGRGGDIRAVDIGQADARALGREGLGDGQADALGGAGHEGCLTV